MKRLMPAVGATFITWVILDFVIHGMILQSTYQATAQLWRPMEETKMGLMYVVTALSALAFAGIYYALVAEKSIASGVKYGILFGIAIGFPMGFGSYCVMPIPLHLAVVWFVGSLVETTVAGILVGAIIKTTDIPCTVSA